MIYEDYHSLKEYEVLMLRGEKGEKGDKGDTGAPGATGQGAWGTIEGDIVEQTDLMEKLDEISQNSEFNSDLIVTAELELMGAVTLPANHITQGFTYNSQGATGTCYMAVVDSGDLISNTRILTFDPDQLSTSEDLSPYTLNPGKTGHYNCLDVVSENSKTIIYATGFGEGNNVTAETYSHILKYNVTDNTSTLIATPQWYYNYLLGYGDAPGSSGYSISYAVAHMASYRMWDVTVFPYVNRSGLTDSQKGKYFPFTRCPYEHYNAIEQGGCIISPYTVLTVLANTRSVSQTGVHSANQLMVRSITGDLLKQIMLTLPYNDELQDCCKIGDDIYINSSGGRIYRLANISQYYRTYYEDNKIPLNWKKPCYLYINEFGDEQYASAVSNYDKQTYKLLKRFRLSPLTYQAHLENATVYVSMQGRHFVGKINPNTKNFDITCSYTWDNYLYTVSLSYTKNSNAEYYYYTLSNAYGTKTTPSGQTTRYTGAENLIKNSFFNSNCFVNCIIADPTIQYTYSPIKLW